MGAAFIHHPATGPWCLGGPQSTHLQPGQRRHNLSQAGCRLHPVGFICLLAASPLADLQMLRSSGPGSGLPQRHTQAPTSMTSLTISGLRAPALVSPAQTHISNCFPDISSNSKCPRQNTCACVYFPQRHLSYWHHHPPRLQPCSHPYSLSPHHHTPSSSTHESAWLYLQTTS